MAIIKAKSKTVSFQNLTPALVWIFQTLDRFARQLTNLPDELIITSINDSIHSPNSRHYSDEAIDLRSKNFQHKSKKLLFARMLTQALNDHPIDKDKFVVLLEDLDGNNEHFHIQVKKDMKFLEV